MAVAAAKTDSKQPPTTDPTPSPTPPSTTTATAATAKARIAAATSTSEARPLTSAKPEKYDFEAKLKAAEENLLEGSEDKREEARLILNELYDRFKDIKLPATSFYLGRYYLAVALYYPPDKDRNRHVKEANVALRNVYLSRETVKGNDVSPFYSLLRLLLKQLKTLTPKENTVDILEIERKIKECEPHILLIDAFKELIKEGNDLLTKGALQACRDAYEQALALIAKENGIEFQVGRIDCLLRLTNTYREDPLKTAECCSRTQVALFKLYNERASLYESRHYTPVQALKMLVSMFTYLKKFTPLTDTQNIDEIQKRITACELELAAKSQPTSASPSTPTVITTSVTSAPTTPSAEPADPPSEKAPRQVTLNAPDFHNRVGMLLVACACIALVSVLSMALYHRINVTVSK